MDDDAYFDSTLDLELYMARTPDADHGGPLSHASAQDMEALNQRLGHGVARLGDTGAAAYLTESKSPPAISYPAAQMHAAAPTVGDGGGDKSKSLGVWRFDKKKKKRVYVSLTGERLEGRRAFSRQREDQLVETYSSHSVRSQLVQMLAYEPRATPDAHGEHKCVPLSAFGLPRSVCVRYESAKVVQLFPWQRDCLLMDDGQVLHGKRNLVYSAPTSGGKTLVAEILMLRRLASLQGNLLRDRSAACRVGVAGEGAAPMRGLGTILFVVPFVALAEEKADYFRSMWQDMHIGVQSYHGDDEGRILTADVEVAVCTIEKANILINQIVDDSSVGVDPMQLSMIVVDELHLVSDSKRGFLLEVLLSKARFIWGDHIQIIGMSATLPNLGDIAKWLQGVLYCTQYRPVELKTAICVDRRLYDPSPELPFNGQWGEKIPPIGTIRPLQEWIIDPNLLYQCSMTSTKSNINVPKLKEFSSSPSYLKAKNYLKSADPDGLISLSVETVLQDKKSVVVFCPSKNWCDRAAVIISDALSILRELESDSTGFALSTSFANESRDFEDSVIVNKSFCMQKISDEKIRTERCRTLVFNLLQCPVGICPILEKSLLQGVAYHHAGLTMDERKIIEKGFRDGIITVLCATSTLAAGVNLPAHRVIIRSPRMGSSELSIASFRQMCGRAGRMNMDTEGEAILMVQNNTKERKLAISLTSIGDLPSLCSGICDGFGGGIARLLLEIIYLEKANTDRELNEYLSYTLWAAQEQDGLESSNIQAAKMKAMSMLVDHEFIILVSESSDRISESGLGVTASGKRMRLSKSQSPQNRYHATPLGKATTLSGLPPSDAVIVLESLQAARRRLVLKSGFHSVFLSTPPSTSIMPNWSNFEILLAHLQQVYPDTSTALEVLGVDYFELGKFARSPPKLGALNDRILFYKRLYSAVLLFCLIQEVPLTKVADSAALNRGQVQQLQKEASTFCGMAISFCKKLNWDILASVLEAYVGRLNYGVAEELLPLVRLGAQIMPPFRARAFFQHNINSPEDIIAAGLDTLTRLLVDALPFDSAAPARAAVSGKETVMGMPNIGFGPEFLMCQKLAGRMIESAQRSISTGGSVVCT